MASIRANGAIANGEWLSSPFAIRQPQCSLFASLRRNPRADRAAHAGAAEAAIAVRVLGQILLVIILGEVEWRRVEDLGGDRPHACGAERLLVSLLRGFGGGALLRSERVDAGAILHADVVALAHPLGRVVAFPERLQELLVGDLLRIVDHEH